MQRFFVALASLALAGCGTHAGVTPPNAVEVTIVSNLAGQYPGSAINVTRLADKANAQHRYAFSATVKERLHRTTTYLEGTFDPATREVDVMESSTD